MKDGNWIPLDKGMAYALPKDRPYTDLEAMYSYTLDMDKGNEKSLHDYSRIWSWSRCKVRKFLEDIKTSRRPLKDHLKTSSRPGIRYIINNLQDTKDQLKTSRRPLKDQQATITINPNPNPKEKPYSSDFETFWKEYPRGDGKGKAFESWQKMKPPINEVLIALNWQKVSDQWKKEDGQFIPMATTYLNQKRWEDKPPKEKPVQQASWLRRETRSQAREARKGCGAGVR